MDQNSVVYNTEVQAEKKNDLVKRSRYYQGLIDSSLLEPGCISFNQLNDAYVIMIMPFDLFGLGKYQYTFRTYCEEDKNLELQDGAVRIFLNTKGTNDEEVSKELIDFLHYVEKTDDKSAETADSERIRKIHECVKRIKSSEEMGVKYMQSWEEKIMEREKGRTEGKVAGKAESILEILEEYGKVSDELSACILAQSDPEILKRWLKVASKVDSIEEFVGKIR